MDPNVTLANIRELAARLRESADEGDPHPDWNVVDDLQTDITALDEWLSKGGFKPEAWS